MPARISREHLSTESLHRAIPALHAAISNVGATIHSHKGDPEVEYALRKDDNALSDVLGILLHEQRMRGIEDEVEATTVKEGEGP